MARAAAKLVAFALIWAWPASTQGAVIEYFDNAAWTAAAGGGLTIIDFEGFGAGAGNGVAITGNEFAGQGLNIVQRDGFQLWAGNTFFPPTPGNVVGQAGVSSSFDGNIFDDSVSDNMDFLFTPNAGVAGLWIGNLSPGPTTVQFLGSDLNTVLASEVFALGHPGMLGAGFNNRIWYGITSDVAIGAIRTIEPPNDGDLILYDNVSFRPAVPEPGTLALLGLGLLAIAVRQRRHR